ncbi:MAG: Zn-ribbon domain-containing OB-fold protein [Dehalococcoidales bacterium]|nr:Zn-ribbon domain-containing OB-fold protein [Dehalococcoidales bacterium]
MAERPISTMSYQQFLNEEKFMGSRCKKCGTLYSPPRPICLKCHSSENMEWAPLKGKGKLATFTSIFVGTPWMVSQGFDRNNPYVCGVVDLEEGVKIDARINGVDGRKPESIKLGTPLTVDFIHCGEGDKQQTIIGFKPV